MRQAPSPAKWRTRWLNRLMSLPVVAKITGVGALVGLLFATIVGYQVQHRMASSLYRNLANAASTATRLLGEGLARPLALGDMATVRQVIVRAAESIPNVAYILVEDSGGEIVAHSFSGPIPAGLESHEYRGEGIVRLQQLEVGGESVMDASAPVLEGKAGHLHVGLSDRPVKMALASVERTIIVTLLVCMVLGQLLALALAFVLTRPIHQLVAVSNRLGTGDFSARAGMSADDEIGRLAHAVNRMADGLQSYDREIGVKERQRQQLLARIVSAQEDERRKLALELHDQLGQSLSSLLLLARQARSHPAPDALGRLESEIQETIGDVRQLAYGLRPAILDDYGLDAALKRSAQTVDGQGPPRVDYQSNLGEGERLSPAMEIALYRIVQEACTNSLRHADASRISIVLLKDARQLTLLVEDDGAGIVPEHRGQESAGLGLAGMRERATLLGGGLLLESTPGQGTLVRVALPLVEQG